MIPLLLSIVLSTAPLDAHGAPPPPSDSLGTWSDVILRELQRHPRMGLGDLYKLLHQGALGSEHAVADEATVRRWLEEEMSVMGFPRGEAVVDTIAPGGAHVRINLRPYLEAGGDPEVLLSAFIETANTGTGSRESLDRAFAAARSLARAGSFPWGEDRLDEYFRQRADAGYPAEHHSRGYFSLYRPAYRVISGDLVATVLATTAGG